jgi:hypothetical protein
MEQLVLLAIFLLVGLVNAILRWRQQGRSAPAPETEPAHLPPRPRTLPPRVRVQLPPPPLETAAVPRPLLPVPPPHPDPRPRRRPRVHPWLGSRAAVRRAIVVMAVLGPCRALEREPGGPAGMLID